MSCLTVLWDFKMKFWEFLPHWENGFHKRVMNHWKNGTNVTNISWTCRKLISEIGLQTEIHVKDHIYIMAVRRVMRRQNTTRIMAEIPTKFCSATKTPGLASSHRELHTGAKSALYNCRSATGEAWQDIMMACSNKASVVCDKASDSAGQRCGSTVAFPYFISFYILCSFLVSSLHIMNLTIPSYSLLQYH